MNDKLLRAFIEASGYEVEEVEGTELWRTIPFLGQTEHAMLNHKEFCGCIISRIETDTENHWELHRKVIDYKLTKKSDKVNDCFHVSSEFPCEDSIGFFLGVEIVEGKNIQFHVDTGDTSLGAIVLSKTNAMMMIEHLKELLNEKV